MISSFLSYFFSTRMMFVVCLVQWFVTTHSNNSTTVYPVAAIEYKNETIVPGAYRFDQYLPLIKGKSIAIFANQTTIVGARHLVDTLKSLGVVPKKIFSPEHGFRGTADAGEHTGDYVDKQTGVPVISLYGSKRKPSPADVKDVDILVFDIQDVGTRFYTYISSLQDFIEAAIEYNKPLIILDRPNPNGFYVDGPVMDLKYKSFIGMQKVPVVYGMTISEYGNMITKEKWIKIKGKVPDVNVDGGKKIILNKCSITIIKCGNYNHNSRYLLPVRPSPNLPNMQSVYLYPSTCFFEGTVLSEGRGTDKPFQVFGHPSLPDSLYSFTPNPTEGAKNSKLYGKLCYGWNLSGTVEEVKQKTGNSIQLKWLMEAYRLFPEKDKFFIMPGSGKMEDSFFNRLAGNNDLWQQIKAGLSEAEIRQSWQPQLNAFKATRKKYLLYQDF